MAGKTNLTATLFSQKKLLGRAHTSNLKSDAQEAIPSNIQVSSQTIFGQSIPDNPALTLYLLQSASVGSPTTVEYVDFIVQPIGGTSYDANTGTFGSVGFGGGDEATAAGTHGYKLVMTGNYEALSSNTSKGNGYYDDDKVVYETLGKVQLIPPNFSNQGANPYFLKLYKGDPTDATNEITSLDETDWQIDYYSGIIFLQDYRNDRVPTHARGFLYVGKMTVDVTGSGGGDITLNSAADNRIITGVNGTTLQGESNLTFDGSSLTVTSTTGGVVIPRMTTAQRNSVSATNGMMIYNTSTNAFQFYQNGSWALLGAGGGGGDTIISVGNGVLTIADDGPGGTYRALLNNYHVSASSYSSKIIYLASTGSSPVASFKIPRKFYFNENGTWHPSPFFSNNPVIATTASVEMPDLHDILHLNGANTEDRAILTGFHTNSGSFSGRVIYLSNAGDTAVGPFSIENKYYFNENGVWFKSPFSAS